MKTRTLLIASLLALACSSAVSKELPTEWLNVSANTVTGTATWLDYTNLEANGISVLYTIKRTEPNKADIRSYMVYDCASGLLTDESGKTIAPSPEQTTAIPSSFCVAL